MLTRGTGKHPNMNVETQIPLELGARQVEFDKCWFAEVDLTGYSPLVLRPIGPTTHWSYDPLVLRPIGPTVIFNLLYIDKI